MDLINNAVKLLEAQATRVPLELFVLMGSFIEEVVAPIPSPFVMTLSGSIAKAQGQLFLYLFILAAVGALGKTLGAWILYIIADKAEDVIVTKYGKFFGVSHREIESIGKRFNKGWQDNVFLFLARATPIIPSAPISVVCGLIKLNIKTYIFSTFLGTTVRNMLFLYVGYVGLSSYEHIVEGLDSVESIVQLLIGIIILGFIVWSYYKRGKAAKTP